MRDTFRKELNKLPKTRSGQEGEVAKESKWPYFQNMLFLKDQFTGRKLQSSILETEINAQPGIDDEAPDGKQKRNTRKRKKTVRLPILPVLKANV